MASCACERGEPLLCDEHAWPVKPHPMLDPGEVWKRVALNVGARLRASEAKVEELEDQLALLRVYTADVREQAHVMVTEARVAEPRREPSWLPLAAEVRDEPGFVG